MIDPISLLIRSPLSAGQSVVACNPATQSEWSSDACRKVGLDWIDQVQHGPVIDGKRTLEVRYTTVRGTGMSSHSVSLLQKAERSYRVLWTHKLFDISNNLGLRNWRIRYRWRYEHRNSRIIVTGTKSIGGSYDLQTGYGSAKRIVGLPTEAYCYAARLEKFVRC